MSPIRMLAVSGLLTLAAAAPAAADSIAYIKDSNARQPRRHRTR